MPLAQSSFQVLIFLCGDKVSLFYSACVWNSLAVSVWRADVDTAVLSQGRCLSGAPILGHSTDMYVSYRRVVPNACG